MPTTLSSCCHPLDDRHRPVDEEDDDDDDDDSDRSEVAWDAIDRLVPSLVADYFLDAAVPVADAELLDRYFRDLQRRD